MTVVPPGAARASGVAPAVPPPGGADPGSAARTQRGQHLLAGWTFVTPALVILGLFMVLPILMALWVSLTAWDGQGSPFSGDVGFVGLENYSRLFLEDGLVRRDFMTSLRNNAWYVLLVVPLQTVFALGLALLLNQQLRARGFFRTAFYFPSVTSSVAISLVFLFLFTGSGTVNALLDVVGISGPTWFADPRGTVHLLGDALGLWSAADPPGWLAGASVGGLSLWDWLAGPSVAMCAIIALVVWTSTGTFMLMFLASLQDLPQDVNEAALVDGTNRWQRFRHVVLPQLKSTVFLVVTLGLIGTWQVFDQVYVMSQGNPAKTTLTPAFLSYLYSFRQNDWGLGAAMAFVLFLIIIVLTSLQRYVMRDKDAVRERRAERARRRAARREGEVVR